MFLVVLTRNTASFKSITAIISARVFSIFGHVTYPANLNERTIDAIDGPCAFHTGSTVLPINIVALAVE